MNRSYPLLLSKPSLAHLFSITARKVLHKKRNRFVFGSPSKKQSSFNADLYIYNLATYPDKVDGDGEEDEEDDEREKYSKNRVLVTFLMNCINHRKDIKLLKKNTNASIS